MKSKRGSPAGLKLSDDQRTCISLSSTLDRINWQREKTSFGWGENDTGGEKVPHIGIIKSAERSKPRVNHSVQIPGNPGTSAETTFCRLHFVSYIFFN